MKITLDLEILPFNTPNYARTKQVGKDETCEDTAIHIRDLSLEALHNLCDQFKRDVFKKAGADLILTSGGEI